MCRNYAREYVIPGTACLVPYFRYRVNAICGEIEFVLTRTSYVVRSTLLYVQLTSVWMLILVACHHKHRGILLWDRPSAAQQPVDLSVMCASSRDDQAMVTPTLILFFVSTIWLHQRRFLYRSIFLSTLSSQVFFAAAWCHLSLHFPSQRQSLDTHIIPSWCGREGVDSRAISTTHIAINTEVVV